MEAGYHLFFMFNIGPIGFALKNSGWRFYEIHVFNIRHAIFYVVSIKTSITEFVKWHPTFRSREKA